MSETPTDTKEKPKDAPSSEPDTNAAPGDSPHACPVQKKKVLIVEDNELNMKLFNDLLEAHGIATVQSNTGLKVMDLAREHAPDLILMDIQLPEVSGLDVIKWLKGDEGLKHIPVIAVTAFAMKGDEDKIRKGGCEDYISKPISVTRFLEVVQRYLNPLAQGSDAGGEHGKQQGREE